MPETATASCGIPRINPQTGLSTDYLNHFSEAVMVLEMLPSMPECAADLMEWKPRTYREHFEASAFSDRIALIGAYDAADPLVRRSVDQLADIMNAMLAATREAIAADIGATRADALALRTVKALKPLIARAAAVINGTAPTIVGAAGPASGEADHASIEALFGR